MEAPNSNKSTALEEKSMRDEIVAAFAEKIIEMTGKLDKDIAPDASQEAVRDLIYSFIEQELENTAIYTSEKYNVSFPYTTIKISDFSKRLYSQYANKPIPEKTSEETGNKKHKEFIFQSFLNPGSGHPFTFFEEALHQVIKKLPSSFEKIKKGAEPDDDEIYTAGSPTNELGTMSPEFLDSLKDNNAFDKFGELYSEFVASRLPENPKELKNTLLHLYGISIGGSLATKTAEHLIEDKVATQSLENSEKNNQPMLSVVVNTLPGSSDVAHKKWQIPAGIALEALYIKLKDEYTKSWMSGEPGFVESMKKILAKRGLLSHMDAEQAKMKNEAIWGEHVLTGNDGIIHNLRSGVPVNEKLKLTEIRGIYDPLQYEDEFRREMQQKRGLVPDSLGTNLTHERENRRVAGARKTHVPAFMRDNELKRIKIAAKSLESLRNKS